MASISKIYSSKLPYRWRAGQHSQKQHKKAVANAPRKHRQRAKKSAMGWSM